MDTAEADDWIEKILQKSSPIVSDDPLEQELAELLVEIAWEHEDGTIGPVLASAYDLLVAAEYYTALSHDGWMYCPKNPPRLFFHYTNCCPRDVLNGIFFFHPSSKPQSGKIGTATSRLLLIFYKEIFKKKGRSEKVLKGSEPVDTIIINEDERKIFFAEIKASPLLIPPISTQAQRLTREVDGETKDRSHDSVDNTSLFGSELELFVPFKEEDGWKDLYYPLGSRRDRTDKAWGFRGMIQLLKDDADFFPTWFNCWSDALNAYHPKQPTNHIFWLTNACGAPSPRPRDWPARRVGDGYESISDSKTSVGMDRTDDIKKGIYQVLKLGSVGKPLSRKWNYKVGLMSNIHAARHFDEYLASLKDIVWTLDNTGHAKKISDLPSNQDIYNLFDGIIALTSVISRDEWIETLFKIER